MKMIKKQFNVCKSTLMYDQNYVMKRTDFAKSSSATKLLHVGLQKMFEIISADKFTICTRNCVHKLAKPRFCRKCIAKLFVVFSLQILRIYIHIYFTYIIHSLNLIGFGMINVFTRCS